MRGEKPAHAHNWSARWGSPPHARGKEKEGVSLSRRSGITPACAGKRASGYPSGGQARDHPRMRGEKFSARSNSAARQGSPPHARGKALPMFRGAMKCGITPACAGKSNALIDSGNIDRGSPPHARGKVCFRFAERAKPGITPACAGKRNLFPSIKSGRRDHPRMRGEKSTSVGNGSDTTGSPPHARGKVFGHIRHFNRPGITPACAGKSDG